MTGCECSDVITVEVKVIYCPQRVVMCRPGWKAQARPGPACFGPAQPSLQLGLHRAWAGPMTVKSPSPRLRPGLSTNVVVVYLYNLNTYFWKVVF